MVRRDEIGPGGEGKVRGSRGSAALEAGHHDALRQDRRAESDERGLVPPPAAADGAEARPPVAGGGSAAAVVPGAVGPLGGVGDEGEGSRGHGGERGQQHEGHAPSRPAEPRTHAVVSPAAVASAAPPLSSKCHFQIS